MNSPSRRGLVLTLLVLAPHTAFAQQRGAARLHQLVSGLTVTPRVLLIGAHPDDDDPQLIAWLARGRQVETGYLSLTRGEGGENFIGNGGTVSLGAIRTGELMAARRIDGGRSFFTRAFDFGYSRTADDAFTHWEHGALLEDVITIVRAFRPHVIVTAFRRGYTDGNGQHEAVWRIAQEAFAAAGDPAACAAARCGAPWKVSALHPRGEGYEVKSAEYDPVLGQSYADIALESRAQHRSEGLLDLFPPVQQFMPVARLAGVVSQVEGTGPAHQLSMFDGVDTSFARLAVGARADVAQLLADFSAAADSARMVLDLARPALVVERLARVARIADAIRGGAEWCRHPAADAVIPALALPTLSAPPSCGQGALDLDASIDLVQRRAHDALLMAAGVSIEVFADRELVAASHKVNVSFAVANHGTLPITLGEVAVTGAADPERTPVVIPPDSTFRFGRLASGFGSAKPWWVATRRKDAFPPVQSAFDGLQQPGDAMALMTVPGVALPEEIRRTSDVRVTLTIAGVTISTSAGPIMYRTASPALGVQERPVGGVPGVTVAFERALEWIPVGKPIDRRLRLMLQSHADIPQTISLLVALAPKGVRVDTLPQRLTLAPREQREVLVHVRGELTPDRYEFGVVAKATTGEQYFEGFHTLEFPHVPPVRFYSSSGLYLQALKIDVPPRLVVAFVRGVGDVGEDALKQLGVPNQAFTPDELTRADLATFTTIVVGPRAYELHPELVAQSGRLLDFARAGGTLVVLNGQQKPRTPTLLPYPASVAIRLPEHVTAAAAPVTMLEPKSRVLAWPNHIEPADWADWVRQRALFVPTAVDAHYTPVVEMHDAGLPENRNTILVTPIGKGTYVYSTLTFADQISAGVPGSLRLFVNLLSAGCRKPVEGDTATGGC